MPYRVIEPILTMNEVDSNNRFFTTESIRYMFDKLKQQYSDVPVVSVNAVNSDPSKFFEMSPLNFCGLAKITQGSRNDIFADFNTLTTPAGFELDKLIADSRSIFYRAAGICDYETNNEGVLIIKTFELIYVTIHFGKPK